MKRDLEQLEKARFDVIVVGGGVYGSFLAWDASLRGLSVALVEKNDFASGASSQSLKTIHGGLRYLQHLDVGRMRASVRERSTLMRIAPHLVDPLPCLMPTSRGLSPRSKGVMRLAMAVSDLVAYDRNRDLLAGKEIPPCRIVPAAECRSIIPGFAEMQASGAALWTDAQVRNSERLIVDVVRAATEAGAAAANHLEMERLIVEKGRVAGIAARDRLSGRELRVGGSLVINAAGSWVPSLLEESGDTPVPFAHRSLVGGFNVVLRRQLLPKYGLGIRASREGAARLYFLVPWNGVTIAGTEYRNLSGRPEEYDVGDDEVDPFLESINRAWPAAELSRSDVSYIHRGVLPARAEGEPEAGRNLLGRYRITDHGKDGVSGLISVLGVKYTTARDVAEKAVDLVMEKLGRRAAPSSTAATLLPQPAAAGARERSPDEAVRHAVREEMALTLEDLVLRRLDAGALRCPDRKELESFAAVMAGELSWDAARAEEEIGAVENCYYHHRRAPGDRERRHG